MKLFSWLRRKPAVQPAPRLDKKLCCANCDSGIHRGDRFRILAAAHLDCGDPKLTGQRSIET